MFGITNYSGFGVGASSGSGTATPPPAPTTASLVWFDLSDPAYMTTSGSYITALADKNGGTYTATGTIVSSTRTCLPTYNTNVQNGLAAGSFTPGLFPQDPCLRVNLTMSSATFTNNLDHSIVFAARVDTIQADANYVYRINLGVIGDEDLSASHLGTTTNDLFTFTNPTDTPTTNVGTATGSSWFIGAMSVAADTTRTWASRLNGSPVGVTTGTASVASNITNISLGNSGQGGNGGINGFIGEVRYFRGRIGTDDIYKEEGYLAWKWGIQANLPSDHPYKNAPP